MSLCCPASLGNRAYPIKWSTSLKKCDHITKQNKTLTLPLLEATKCHSSQTSAGISSHPRNTHAGILVWLELGQSCVCCHNCDEFNAQLPCCAWRILFSWCYWPPLVLTIFSRAEGLCRKSWLFFNLFF